MPDAEDEVVGIETGMESSERGRLFEFDPQVLTQDGMSEIIDHEHTFRKKCSERIVVTIARSATTARSTSRRKG